MLHGPGRGNRLQSSLEVKAREIARNHAQHQDAALRHRDERSGCRSSHRQHQNLRARLSGEHQRLIRLSNYDFTLAVSV